jgi:hypothetical protein
MCYGGNLSCVSGRGISIGGVLPPNDSNVPSVSSGGDTRVLREG